MDNCTNGLKQDILAVQLEELWLERLIYVIHNICYQNTGLATDYLGNLLPTASHIDMHYATLITHHSFHAKQNSILILSFLPQSVNGTRNAQSVQVFKTKLQTQKHKPTINYNSGALINQILHCRLRLGCSSLNHDLYRKNIINSPLCTCGHVLEKLAMPNNCQQFTILRWQITSRHKCPNCHELT